MTKQLLRSSIASCCRATGILALAEHRNRPNLTILCYHRVLPAERKAAYCLSHLAVTPEAFKEHCAVLARHYEVLTLNDAVTALKTSRTATKPLAAITFDDGYRDNLEYAAPILDKADLKATFFIVAGLVGKQCSPWYDKLIRAASTLYERQRLGAMLASTSLEGTGGLALTPKGVLDQAKTLAPEKRTALLETLLHEAGDTDTPDPLDVIMNWDELKQLVEAGHEIGSHTLTHELLPLLDDTALRSEIVEARALLKQHLDQPIPSFCFPNGDHDKRTLREVQEAGHTCAVTTVSGNNAPGSDLHRLCRWDIDEGRLARATGGPSATLLRLELSQLADRVFLRNRTRRNQSS